MRRMFALVRTLCALASCALVPRGPLLPQPLLRFLRIILLFHASVIGGIGNRISHVVMYDLYLRQDEGYGRAQSTS